MTNIVQIQKDLHELLLSYPGLSKINIVLFRKMQIESQVNMSLVYLNKRMGFSGAGVLVEMPVASGNDSSVKGPILEWAFPITAVEMPLMSFQSGVGAALSAEDIIQLILDCVHLYADDAVGTFQVDKSAITPVTNWPGCVGYRAMFRIKAKNTQTTRTGQVLITQTGAQVTIACALDPTAEIRYTVDGSFPGRVGNPQSQIYAGALDVESGQTIRAVGWMDGKNNSAATSLLIT